MIQFSPSLASGHNSFQFERGKAITCVLQVTWNQPTIFFFFTFNQGALGGHILYTVHLAWGRQHHHYFWQGTKTAGHSQSYIASVALGACACAFYVCRGGWQAASKRLENQCFQSTALYVFLWYKKTAKPEAEFKVNLTQLIFLYNHLQHPAFLALIWS